MDAIDQNLVATDGGVVDLGRLMAQGRPVGNSRDRIDHQRRRVELAGTIRNQQPLELADSDDDAVIERSDCET